LVGTGSVGGNVGNLHASIIKRREYITARNMDAAAATASCRLDTFF
jgi:hypothetical protein